MKTNIRTIPINQARQSAASARRRSGWSGRLNAELPTASRAPWSVAKLAFLCLLAACCLAIPVHAGVVTNLADDGSAGTLRAVIAAASPGETISFDVTGTITLTNGQLTIDKNLTIAGPGASQLAVNGNAASRVFYIKRGNTVTIAGLTITNGSVSGNDVDGGGIYNDHATLTVSNCTLSANSAGSVGGGIFNYGRFGSVTLTVANSTFSSNSAAPRTFGAATDIGAFEFEVRTPEVAITGPASIVIHR